MDIYEEHENTVKRCENLENQIIRQEEENKKLKNLLAESGDTMVKMLEDFQVASIMLDNTSYCKKCGGILDNNCPFRGTDDKSECYYAYGDEDRVTLLIDKIHNVL